MNQELKTSQIEELGKFCPPEAIWRVPNIRGEATFIFPAFGPDVYNVVVSHILANKQRLPTGELTAFMLDEAYNSTNEEVKNSQRSKFVREDMMYNRWVWVPNINVWTPVADKNSGMYAVFDENGEGLGRVYTREELEDRLSGGSTERGVRFSEDRKVAFSPRCLITNEHHEKGTLAQDGAFIANYGVEGAEKLDSVAKVFTFNPYSLIVNNTSDKLIQTLSALYRNGRIGDSRLNVLFIALDDSWSGYVLPVSGSRLSL